MDDHHARPLIRGVARLSLVFAVLLVLALPASSERPATWNPLPQDQLSPLPTSRSSPQADLGPGTPRMTTDGVSPVPSPDSAARTEVPAPARAVTPAPRVTPKPKATRTRPAPTAKPRTAVLLRGTLRGNATWFASPQNVSAAGPALRRAIGPGWRGTRVRVCSGGRCAWTVLGDWCACRRGNRVIDLDDNVMAALGGIDRGVIPVTVRW